ncbi:ABC transporter substrate-binding protein [Mobilitalea sibirica]|uniref:ABC transporter substrate-binding protein n=1 Tax=Mobilitalea sibirica TaxID=1462919 RepID=A0A8J7HCA2_9FIRM|nr:ABC transporter substrate-binding protein [Mobilitalea sibirica]MBH1941891.1 ABC transporter substrate-binding protein [Mobilitalea sibirica]
MKVLKSVLLFLICMALLAGCTKKADPADDVKNNEKTTVDAEAGKGTKEEETNELENQNTEPEASNDTAAKDKVDINIAALKGPTAIGMVKIMEDAETGEASNNYSFTIAGAADEISAGLIKGEFDIAAVPSNLASVLYNKTEGAIKLAGINTLGVLYIVETGNEINSVEDLKGKTIYSTGFGTTPQYTLNYLLNSYGLDPEKDVTVEYKTEATEVAAMLSQSDNAIAMLPQPYITTVMMNNDKVRIALSVADEWDGVNSESSVITGVIVVRKEFLEKTPDAFNAFMEEYERSTTFANENMDDTAALVEKFGIFKAAVAKKAIPYCNITLITGDEMKDKVQGYLGTLFTQNPAAIGGKLPAEDFYYLP